MLNRTPSTSLTHLIKELGELSQLTGQPLQIDEPQEMAWFDIPYHNEILFFTEDNEEICEHFDGNLEEISYRQMQPSTPTFSIEQRAALFKFYTKAHELLQYIETDTNNQEKYQELRQKFKLCSVLSLLGWCYQQGIGIPQSDVKAESYYEASGRATSTATGSTIARHNLALMRLSQSSLKQETKLKEIAALKSLYDNLGKEISTSVVAVSYPLQLENGEQQEKMLYHAASVGNFLAQYYLAKKINHQRGFYFVHPIDATGFHLLEKAAFANYDRALFALGMIYFDPRSSYADITKAHDCWMKASEQNQFVGILCFANYLAQKAEKTTRDFVQLADILKRAMKNEKMDHPQLALALIKINRPSFWQKDPNVKTTTVNMLVELNYFTENELEELFKKFITDNFIGSGFELIDRIYPELQKRETDSLKKLEYAIKIEQCYEAIVRARENKLPYDHIFHMNDDDSKSESRRNPTISDVQKFIKDDSDKVHRYIPYFKETKVVCCNYEEYDGYEGEYEQAVISKEGAKKLFCVLANQPRATRVESLRIRMPESKEPWAIDRPMTLFELALTSYIDERIHIPPFKRECLMSFTLKSFYILDQHATFLQEWLKEKNTSLTSLTLESVRFDKIETAIKTLNAIFTHDYLQNLALRRAFTAEEIKHFLATKPAEMKAPLKKLSYERWTDDDDEMKPLTLPTSTLHSDFIRCLQSPMLDTLDVHVEDMPDADRENLFKILAKQNTLTRLEISRSSHKDLLKSSLKSLSKLEHIIVSSCDDVILYLIFLLNRFPSLHTIDLDGSFDGNYEEFQFQIGNLMRNVSNLLKLRIYSQISDDSGVDCDRLKKIFQSKVDGVGIQVRNNLGHLANFNFTPNITLKNHWCQLIALIRFVTANLDSPFVMSILPLLENIALLAGNKEVKPFAADRFMETRFFRNIINRARLIQAPLESANSSSSRSGIKRKQVL